MHELAEGATGSKNLNAYILEFAVILFCSQRFCFMTEWSALFLKSFDTDLYRSTSIKVCWERRKVA